MLSGGSYEDSNHEVARVSHPLFTQIFRHKEREKIQIGKTQPSALAFGWVFLEECFFLEGNFLEKGSLFLFFEGNF